MQDATATPGDAGERKEPGRWNRFGLGVPDAATIPGPKTPYVDILMMSARCAPTTKSVLKLHVMR
jgi:hypothetical protein